ncbi:BolA family transcriptional regulator [Betaproteobacteria bacterium SCN2]|jgi:BolA protein|nr:BolA family transcriptional regulator [Betaproteobacteria bacterium SCN2]
MNLEDEIYNRLDALSPSSVALEDESSQHAGHAGAAGGKHYRLTIVSSRFQGLGAVERHRLVYEALGDLMQKGIHALAINAYGPEEF